MTVSVKWVREIGVFCAKTFQLVDPGEAITYHLSVLNTGEFQENVTCALTGIGRDEWVVGSHPDSMILKPNECEPLEIALTAPPDANENEIFTVEVEFRWEDGSPAHDRIILRTVVNPTFFVTMALNRTSATARPGDMVSFNVTVGNAGNMGGTAFVEVAILTDPGDWTVLLSEDTVTLWSGERRTIVLLMEVPYNATGGELIVVQLRAFCPEPFSEIVREARIFVKEIHELIVPIGPINVEIAPTDMEKISIHLLNKGNLYETVQFRMDGVERGWTWWFTDDSYQVDMVRLGPDEEKGLDLWLSVPPDTQTGTYDIVVYFDGDDFTFGSVIVKVEISHVSNIELKSISGKSTVYPGGYFEGEFGVVNHGNGPEYVDISTNPDFLLNSRFILDGLNCSSVWVPFHGSRSVRIVAWVAEDVPITGHSFLVCGISRNDPTVRQNLSMRYQVVEPILTVIAVEIFPQKPNVNEVINVHVILQNNGSIELIEIVASLSGGGEERIESIAPEGQATAVFTWVSSDSGEVEISGEIEHGPGNNSMTWSRIIRVTDDQSDDLIPFTGPIIVIPIVLVILVILIIVFHPSKKIA
jgi:uncharacterized membrane protein